MARMMTMKNWHHRMQSSAINSQIKTAAAINLGGAAG